MVEAFAEFEDAVAFFAAACGDAAVVFWAAGVRGVGRGWEGIGGGEVRDGR